MNTIAAIFAGLVMFSIPLMPLGLLCWAARMHAHSDGYQYRIMWHPGAGYTVHRRHAWWPFWSKVLDGVSTSEQARDWIEEKEKDRATARRLRRQKRRVAPVRYLSLCADKNGKVSRLD